MRSSSSIGTSLHALLKLTSKNSENVLLRQVKRSQRFGIWAPTELAPERTVAAEGDSSHDAAQNHDSGENEHVQDEIHLLFHVVDGNLLIQRDVGFVPDAG